MTPPAAPLIDHEHATFLRGGVSIFIGSCDADGMPCVTRAVGCKLSDDLRSMSVFVALSQSVALLEDIRRSSAIAVVCDKPSTHRSLQLKGRDARLRPLETGELALVAAYCEAFVAELEPLGYAPLLIRTLLSCDDADIVALQFTPCAAFTQTPGPQAGQPLRTGA